MGEIIGIHLQTGAVLAYTAAPTLAERAGAVLLLHDVWGLDDHTKSVADRLAAQGYHVLAPNMLAGTEAEKHIRPELQAALFSSSRRQRSEAQMHLASAVAPLRLPHIASQVIMRVHACFEYLYNQPLLRQEITVIGFGFGGSHTFSLAVREPRLTCAVVYYGHTAYVGWELRHIQCPVLAFYGEQDHAVIGDLVRLRPSMQQAGVDFTPVVYDGAGPFFFNDTMMGAYDAHAAQDSWARTMSFMRKYMR